MNIQDVLAKVTKLRALAQSSNVNEATAAALAADKLIQAHRLTEADLEAAGQVPTERAEVAPEYLQEGKIQSWERALGAVLAEHYGCLVVSGRKGSTTVNQKIVGRPSDVATVRYLFAWLKAEIIRLADKHARRNYAPKEQGPARHSFSVGAVNGLAVQLEAQRPAQAQTSGAIVLASREGEARQAAQAAFPDAKQTTIHTRDSNLEARYAGFKRGATMSLASGPGLPAPAQKIRGA